MLRGSIENPKTMQIVVKICPENPRNSQGYFSNRKWTVDSSCGGQIRLFSPTSQICIMLNHRQQRSGGAFPGDSIPDLVTGGGLTENIRHAKLV
jgi:hypothetical protein